MFLLKYFRHIVQQGNHYADYLAGKQVYATNVVGWARSILATGTLLTFLFSPYDALFDPGVTKAANIAFFDAGNLFNLIAHPLAVRLVACTILLAVISGYLPQLTGILHWWVCASLANKGALIDGGDQISMILSLFLVPVTLLDPRKNHWTTGVHYHRPYTHIFVNFILMLIGLQMAIIYIHSTFEKLKVPEWLNGTAVYYFLNHDLYGAVPIVKRVMTPLFLNPYITLLLGWGTLILEMMLFAALFMSKTNRKKMLIAGLIFHFAIILFHGLMSFFFAMAAGLILYLFPVDEQIKLTERKMSLDGKLQ